MNLHRTVSRVADLHLVAEVIGRIRCIRNARFILRGEIVRPELDVPRRNSGPRLDAVDIREDVHVRHVLLKDDLVVERRHADRLHVVRERVDRHPGVLGLSVLVEFEEVRNAAELLHVVVGPVELVERLAVRLRRQVHRSGDVEVVDRLVVGRFRGRHAARLIAIGALLRPDGCERRTVRPEDLGQFAEPGLGHLFITLRARMEAVGEIGRRLSLLMRIVERTVHVKVVHRPALRQEIVHDALDVRVDHRLETLHQIRIVRPAEQRRRDDVRLRQ